MLARRAGQPIGGLPLATLAMVVLGGLFVTTVFVPFVGDEVWAGSSAAVTAFPLVLTAARLRR